jgi:hypothetical protein
MVRQVCVTFTTGALPSRPGNTHAAAQTGAALLRVLRGQG